MYRARFGGGIIAVWHMPKTPKYLGGP